MITPIGKRVILRPLIDKMTGLIEIPEPYQQSQTAEVVAIGAKVKLDLKPGDRVLFDPNAAWTNIEFEGEQLRAMHEQFLLGVLETV